MRISDWSSDVCSSDLCHSFQRASPHLATHTHGNCVLATRLYDAIKETQDGDAEPIITFREFRMRGPLRTEIGSGRWCPPTGNPAWGAECPIPPPMPAPPALRHTGYIEAVSFSVSSAKHAALRTAPWRHRIPTVRRQAET